MDRGDVRYLQFEVGERLKTVITIKGNEEPAIAMRIIQHETLLSFGDHRCPLVAGQQQQFTVQRFGLFDGSGQLFAGVHIHQRGGVPRHVKTQVTVLGGEQIRTVDIEHALSWGSGRLDRIAPVKLPIVIGDSLIIHWLYSQKRSDYPQG